MFPVWVKDYIGIPFEELNCWQLFCRVYEEQFNIILPLFKNEYAGPMDKKNIKKLYEREVPISWIKVNPPEIGDAILLRVQGQPWHVGIIVASKHMLHTQEAMSSIIEKITGPIWRNRIMGFYHYVQ